MYVFIVNANINNKIILVLGLIIPGICHGNKNGVSLWKPE